IDSPRPTRAEVSDVANSVLGGTDAVMLSAETAKGKYPVESVKVFDKICKKADDAVKPNFDIMRKGESVFEIVAHAVANAAERMNAKAILTFTSTGNTACVLARYRSHVPVFAFTRDARIRKKLSLVWGAESFELDKTSGMSDKMIANGIRALLENKRIKKGDTVVITAGISVGKAGVTNMAEIRVV
ncbi:MAG: pyruvate kinase, partial [Candidatus Aenigmarchaeota archaeon]|nr:pyruvate kinase [Candidatus Aenigmarchaeota archaeon]